MDIKQIRVASIEELWGLFDNGKFKTFEEIKQFVEVLKREFACPAKWKRMIVYTAREAALVYHEIDPDSFRFSNLTVDVLTEILSYVDYKEGIWDNLQRYFQIHSKQIITHKEFKSFIEEHGYEGTTPLMEEDFELPESFDTNEDVKAIDFDAMPPRLLRALGVNLMAQARKRKDMHVGNKTNVSAFIRSKSVESFLNDCNVCKGTEKYDESTITKLISHQFRKE